jgi:hypothetical protein
MRAGTLDERLADAFAAVHGPALLIGMDTPRAAADTGLNVTGQWRHADRAFVSVATRTACEKPG